MADDDDKVENAPEVARVRQLLERFKEAANAMNTKGVEVEALAAFKLPYAHEIMSYELGGIKPKEDKSPPYQTDLLFRDVDKNSGHWIPRVIVEFKFGSVTTHDALTYSAKAYTHKHVHPYLRYGTVVGGFWKIPPRLVRHGAYFDFMAVWENAQPTNKEWQALIDILASEIQASRRLQEILAGEADCCLLHKGMSFKFIPPR